MNYQYKVSTKKQRLTLGLLSDNAAYESESKILLGAMEAAEKHDVNLIYINHLENESTSNPSLNFSDLDQQFNKQVRSKYDKLEVAIQQLDIDGLLFIGWSKDFISGNIQFLQEAIKSIPLYSLGQDFSDIPSVYMHGGEYIKELVSHLINDHGSKNIAFIEPWNRDTRIENFREIMKKYKLYNENLILSHEDVAEISEGIGRVRKALSILFDERKPTLDAIMVMTALEGKYALELLNERGLRVPEDIKLICYEDHPSIAYSKPPLTTVDYPFKKIGYRGCEQLITLLRTGEIPLITEVSTTIIYRDSCGCTMNQIQYLNNQEKNVAKNSQSIDKKLIEIDAILSNSYKNIPIPLLKLSQLFLSDIKEEKENIFISEFQQQLMAYANEKTEKQIIEMINDLRELLLPLYSDNSVHNLRAEKIWYTARLIAKEITNHSIITEYIKTSRVNRVLGVINQTLLSAYSTTKIVSVLENSLKELSIPTCYMILSNEQSDKEQTLVFSYFNYQKHTLSVSSLDKVYEDFRQRKNGRYTLVFMLHHLNQDKVAIALMELAQNQGHIIISLGVQISSALQGSLLLDESKKLVHKLAYFADTDMLTNLFNRRFFYNSLNNLISEGKLFSIFYIDIDGFKSVNDSHGHDAGDLLLQQITSRIISILGSVSYQLTHESLQGEAKANAIFRLGGDEFTVLINSVDSKELTLYATKLIESVKSPYYISNREIKVSCSVGISIYSKNSKDAQKLIKQADLALYTAKSKKDTFTFYEDS